jgi:hypothetical protein
MFLEMVTVIKCKWVDSIIIIIILRISDIEFSSILLLLYSLLGTSSTVYYDLETWNLPPQFFF